LQDALGDINDIGVHETLTAELVENGDGQSPNGARGRRRAFAAGFVCGQEQCRIEGLLSAAADAGAELAATKPFWR